MESCGYKTVTSSSIKKHIIITVYFDLYSIWSLLHNDICYIKDLLKTFRWERDHNNGFLLHVCYYPRTKVNKVKQRN